MQEFIKENISVGEEGTGFFILNGGLQIKRRNLLALQLKYGPDIGWILTTGPLCGWEDPAAVIFSGKQEREDFESTHRRAQDQDICLPHQTRGWQMLSQCRLLVRNTRSSLHIEAYLTETLKYRFWWFRTQDQQQMKYMVYLICCLWKKTQKVCQCFVIWGKRCIIKQLIGNVIITHNSEIKGNAPRSLTGIGQHRMIWEKHLDSCLC